MIFRKKAQNFFPPRLYNKREIPLEKGQERNIMNFIKKMCILRQVKQGFSGDGKTLSGLIKIEQYGKNLSVEVSVINFAPLSSGEYYCLLADSRGRTEMLPLRGKSLFNIVSELNAEEGFCGVICFVKNGIVPIAYGVNGQNVYDWRTLVQNSVPPRTKETAYAAGTGNADDFMSFGSESSESGTPRGEAPESAENIFSPRYEESPQNLPPTTEKRPGEAPQTPVPERPQPPRPAHETPPDPQEASINEPPREGTNARKAEGKYDDETVATENYYDKEKGNHERIENEESGTYAYAESGNQEQAEKERQNVAANGDAENVRNPFTTDSDGYYLAVKGEIDALFEKYPSDDSLKEVFAYSEWVRVRGEEGKAEYLIGVIYDDMKAKYICYALPAEDKERPPEEVKEICTFVPSSAFTDKEGFFVIFQSCSTGECIRPESL